MSGIINLSELMEVPSINNRRAVGLTQDKIERRFGPRLRLDAIETAIAHLERSIEDAEGRWENLTVMEVYKKAPCWTIKSNRVKFTDGSVSNQENGVLNVANENATMQSKLSKENVDISIRIGAQQLELDWGGGKISKSHTVYGSDVAKTLSGLLAIVKKGMLDDNLHELNKLGRKCKAPKQYVEKYDRYLKDDDVLTLDTYVKDNGLNPQDV